MHWIETGKKGEGNRNQFEMEAKQGGLLRRKKEKEKKQGIGIGLGKTKREK